MECSTTELPQRKRRGEAAPARREYCHREVNGATALALRAPLRISSAMTTHKTPETLAAEAERKKRLAQALRDNLRRRKAQANGRRDRVPPEPGKPREG